MTTSIESSLIPHHDIPPEGPFQSYQKFDSYAALEGYIKRLHTLRKGLKLTANHRLRQPISFPHVAAQRPIGDGRIPSCPPPRFHQPDDDDGIGLFVGDLVFRKVVKRPPTGGIQVWIADVVALGDTKAAPLGRVVLRILQQSLMHIPDLGNAEDSPGGPKLLYTLALNRLATDYRVYEDMKELQGSVLPYCLGLHKMKMRNGETAYALMLEYVEGETLETWSDNRSNGPIPPYDQAWFDQLSDDEAKQYEESCEAEQERVGPHSDTIYEPPNAKSVQFLADAKQLLPILFDTIDTLNKQDILLDLSMEDLVITEEGNKPKSVVLTQFIVFDHSSEQKWTNQGSSFLSWMVNCCNTHRPHLLSWAEQERCGFVNALPGGDESKVASTGT